MVYLLCPKNEKTHADLTYGNTMLAEICINVIICLGMHGNGICYQSKWALILPLRGLFSRPDQRPYSAPHPLISYD